MRFSVSLFLCELCCVRVHQWARSLPANIRWANLSARSLASPVYLGVCKVHVKPAPGCMHHTTRARSRAHTYTIWVLADISTRNQTKRKDVFLNLHVFYGSVGGLSAYLLRAAKTARERRERRPPRERVPQRKRPHKDTRGTHHRGHCSMWLPFISNLAPKQHIGNDIQHRMPYKKRRA